MIARIWNGYASKANAGKYENLLREEIFVSIEKRKIRGYRGIQLLRRDLHDEVEFTTIMWYDNMESVKAFSGDDYEMAYVPPSARLLLERFDEKSVHSELRYNLQYDLDS